MTTTTTPTTCPTTWCTELHTWDEPEFHSLRVGFASLFAAIGQTEPSVMVSSKPSGYTLTEARALRDHLAAVLDATDTPLSLSERVAAVVRGT